MNRWFTANGITPVKPASKLLMSFSKTQSFLFFYAFSFILLYVAVPRPPENVTVITKTSRVVNMSWTPGFNGNSDILNYTVEISTDNQTFTEARCQGLSSGGLCGIKLLHKCFFCRPTSWKDILHTSVCY